MRDRSAAAELRMIFGDAVRRRRQELGLSQRAMASLHGFSQRLLCAVETGSDNMTIRTMARFAAAVDGEGPSRDLGDHAALAKVRSALAIRSNRCPNPAPSVPL